MPRPILMTADDAPTLFDRLSQALSGQYQIERTLGHGGMGTVFLARDLTLGRQVAIKVISPDVGTSAELRQRFAQEARTVARLRHPNIVTVFAAGETSGLLYFVMEYVPGDSLRERLNRQQVLPSEEAIPILHDVALALDSAHAAGIVHRDVKPENILLDRDTGRAMLTDFGVARALADPGNITGSGFVLGSPRYMSPEQASGDEALDGRSDLYSLGLIGYELFSGTPAVEAATAASILVKQITEKPQPLSRKAPGIRPEVASAIDRLLLKAPSERFQRGAAFAAALRGETFDDATPTHQIGRASSGARRIAPPRTRRAVALSALAVSLLGIFFFWNRSHNDGNDKTWFIAPFEVQGPDRSLDWLREGSLNMLTLSLAQWNDLQIVEYERSLDLLRSARLDATARVGLDEARALARRAGAGRVVMGQVTAIGDSLIVTASLYDVRSGRSTDKARVAALKTGDPRPVFESIASELLDLVGAPRLTFELTKQTTASVSAYRHYLEGLRLLNSWRLRDADTAFSQAIAADSTFALAYYKKSLGLGWSSSSDTMRTIAAERAVRFADRLPARRQEIVRGHAELTRAFSAMSAGDTVAMQREFLAARARVAKLVASDSTDAEASYALADADYHLVWNTSYGSSPDSTAKYLTESVRGFQRTIRIDSTFHLAYQHLVDMYAQAGTARSYLVLVGDTIKAGGTDSYERRLGTVEQVEQLRIRAQTRALEAAVGWIAADPDASNARLSLATIYEQRGQADSAIGVLREALTRPTTADPSFEWRIPFIKAKAGMPAAGPELRTVLNRFPADSLRRFGYVDRLQGVFGTMTVGGQTGMPSLVDAAAKLLAQTDPVLPGAEPVRSESVAGWLSTGIKIGMGMPMTATARATLLDGARALDRSKAPGRRDPTVPYMVYLETRDSAFATIASAWSPAGTSPYPELQALVALRRGDTAAAARLAQSFPSPDSLRRAALGMTGLRTVARATVMAELGDVRRAVALYETIDPKRFAQTSVPETSWPMYVRSHAARARLYEAIGERERAIAAYERFLTLWKDADAPLQPQLREAREALARLRDAGTPVKAVVR